MSVNRYLPHIMMLPEDDANRQIANGFLLEPDLSPQVQILPPADGWTKVLQRFELDHVRDMAVYQHRHIVLLIDFDGDGDRLAEAKRSIPAHLLERVMVLGVWTEPERLRTYESTGRELASECRAERDTVWQHPLLKHNAAEIDRLRERVRPILFPPA